MYTCCIINKKLNFSSVDPKWRVSKRYLFRILRVSFRNVLEIQLFMKRLRVASNTWEDCPATNWCKFHEWRGGCLIADVLSYWVHSWLSLNRHLSWQTPLKAGLHDTTLSHTFFVQQAYDRPTTWLRTYTTIVSELQVWFTRNNSCRRPVVSLSYATKSYHVNQP